MKLYEITEQYRMIAEAIDANGGEMTPELEMALTAAEGDLASKADNIAALIAEAEHEAEAYQHEADRLSMKAATLNHKVGSLKEFLKNGLKAAGETKVKGSRFEVRIQKNSQPAVRQTVPDAQIEPEYMRTFASPDRDKVRQSIQRGIVPFGFEVIHGDHLRIK